MLARDGHVARRNLLPMLLQNLLQPLLLVFVFGRVLTTGGLMAARFKDVMLPGVMAISMALSGVQAVAMPLITEFQFTREIEDRLLAPMANGWLVAGLVVIPAAWLVIGSDVHISMLHPFEFVAICLLVSLFSASGGLALGCTVGQTQIGLMFSLVLAPMMMFGCAYYPWSMLSAFPGLQYAVLINPLVYASEGLRGALAPQVPHMPVAAVLGALLAIDILLVTVGIRQFNKKALS
jgi:ABC-2 type transport system permease protein